MPVTARIVAMIMNSIQWRLGAMRSISASGAGLPGSCDSETQPALRNTEQTLNL